jgi:succinate-semialdehyde dehydrogenase/glutarate-semialdehyde dehydrogenase
MTEQAVRALMHLGGEWVASESGEELACTSPATGEALGTVPTGTREDVRSAIAAARAAAPAWARTSPFERARALERIAAEVDARRDALARLLTLDQGKPLLAEAYGEVAETIAYLTMAAADAPRLEGSMPPSADARKRVLVYRVPKGVAGAITPWNWPQTTGAALFGPALAGGNAVVWIPAPTTALSSLALAECVAEADLPPGVFNIVTGVGPVVGDELAANPGTNAIGFIGSIATGHEVARRAAGKALVLELGGNGPTVVLEDADVDAAVAAALPAAFLCAGQSCTAGELFLVHERRRDEFVEKVAAAVAATVRLGDPFDSATTMGPLNNAAVAAKVDRHVGQAVAAGARVVLGGRRAPGYPTDLYYEPTVLDGVTTAMEIATEETFGPVVPVATIRHEDEALAHVESSAYGLLASVWTSDLARGLRFAERVRSGWVNVNEGSNYWEIHLPFGGRAGSQSGVGRDNGRYAVEAFTELKTVVFGLD